MKKVLLFIFIFATGILYGQDVMPEFKGYIGMTTDSRVSDGEKFNKFMLENEGETVHLDIILDDDQIDSYVNGRTKIYYFFPVFNSNDRTAGCDIHIMLYGANSIESVYNFDEEEKRIEGYFEVNKVSEPESGIISVDIIPYVKPK